MALTYRIDGISKSNFLPCSKAENQQLTQNTIWIVFNLKNRKKVPLHDQTLHNTSNLQVQINLNTNA